ncbi:ATP-binding cassette domain-containing protein [bacterium]|nr:ATP-binding cassette domain-containing protein [bacterium]
MLSIEAKELGRHFKIRDRGESLGAAVQSFLSPKWKIKDAVSDVSFGIQQGEIVGLVGANGAGKTTLLKMIAGLLHPTHGSVSSLGFTPHQRDKAYLKQIGMVMGQKSQMWVDIPAWDTFMLLADIYDLDPAKARARVEKLAKQFRVFDQLGVQVRRLSLGERMKMEIIAAVLHEPKILILDEPTIGLDVLAKDVIRNFVLEYNKEEETSIILSSHDMEDISELCDKLIVINKGKLVYNGDLESFSKDKNLKQWIQSIISEE